MIHFLQHSPLVKHNALLLLICLVTACASQPLGRVDLLNFIEDGKTTREQAFLNLGEPAASYEGGRILCFRLGHDKGGDYIVGSAIRFTGVKSSLVMVFDEQGILTRHSLVQVKGQ